MLNWVRTVIISGSTDYRRYQAAAIRQRYAVRFSCASGPVASLHPHDAGRSGIVIAPKRLNDEMAESFASRLDIRCLRHAENGVWERRQLPRRWSISGYGSGRSWPHPRAKYMGLGVDPKLLTFAMMIFPQVWDWYLHWRERRRGFYTKWEIDLLSIAAAICREETGWLRQSPPMGAAFGRLRAWLPG